MECLHGPVQFHLDEKTGVARIIFNRPEVLNAIDVSTAKAFAKAAISAARNPLVRVIVIAGEGKAFVAGGDVACFGKDLDSVAGVIHELLDALNPALLALRQSHAPVLAAVKGAAAGAGFSLVLGADYVVASQNSIFQLAYDRIGAQPDCGGTWFLERRIGRTRSFELMLSGKRLDCSKALEWGIVNEVVNDDDFDERVKKLALDIAAGPTRAYGQFKRLIDEAPSQSLATHLEAERLAFVAVTATKDFREGVLAFVQKRVACFIGQ